MLGSVRRLRALRYRRRRSAFGNGRFRWLGHVVGFRPDDCAMLQANAAHNPTRRGDARLLQHAFAVRMKRTLMVPEWGQAPATVRGCCQLGGHRLDRAFGRHTPASDSHPRRRAPIHWCGPCRRVNAGMVQLSRLLGRAFDRVAGFRPAVVATTHTDGIGVPHRMQRRYGQRRTVARLAVDCHDR